MATIIRTQRNHYEVLGLSPSASKSEIDEAFGRELLLSRTRAFGALAEVSIAYEALRDPARRKAYDRSIGVNQTPPPVTAPTTVSFRSSAHFITAPAEPRADPLPAPKADPLPLPEEPKVEPRTASFIAASLRSPAPAPRRRGGADGAPAPADAADHRGRHRGAGVRMAPARGRRQHRHRRGRRARRLGWDRSRQ